MKRRRLVQPRCFEMGVPAFRLEAGPPLPRLHLSGWWWGLDGDVAALDRRTRRTACATTPTAPPSPGVPPASAPRLDPDIPTVLLIHALTGNAQAGGPGGWWAPLVGPGRPLDPTRARLLCFNNLGGCYGTFGPPATDWPWSSGLPCSVTTWDQARALLRALDLLGVERVEAAIGGSLGGMIVTALGALAPERFARLVPVAASESASAWIIGLNHVARQAILLDPSWPDDPARGLSLARQIAQMSYRAEPGLSQRQGRLLRAPEPHPQPFTSVWTASAPYAQQTYLEHQGKKLVARFDPMSYLVQLSAMDHHDIERRPPDPDPEDNYRIGPEPWQGRPRLTGAVEAIGIDSDVLYAAAHMKNLAAGARQGRYHEIRSIHGHDAFLIEWDQLDAILRSLGAPFDGTDHD